MSLDDVLMCGSKNAMSPPWATMSSRFCVVCARAGPGSTATAPAAAAAPVISSRRVMPVMDASLGALIWGWTAPPVKRCPAVPQSRKCDVTRVLDSSPRCTSTVADDAELGQWIERYNREAREHRERSQRHSEQGTALDVDSP